MYTDKYWNRKSRKQKDFKTKASFHLAFMGTLFTVCLINYMMVLWLGGQSSQLPIVLVLPTYLVAAYLGGKLLLASKQPWVSFAGTSLVGLPLGLVAYSLVGGKIEFFLMQVLFTTTVSVVIVGLIQIITNQMKLPVWAILASALASAVFFNVLFTDDFMEAPVMNWVCVLFIHARIGHVWGRARVVTPSIDNGIDGVGVLILETLNPLYYYEALKRLTK
jgi:hypothetical protein